jgi:hypothetical protein
MPVSFYDIKDPNIPCCICLDPYGPKMTHKPGENHIVHKTCIQRWAWRAELPTCPICRIEFDAASIFTRREYASYCLHSFKKKTIKQINNATEFLAENVNRGIVRIRSLLPTRVDNLLASNRWAFGTTANGATVMTGLYFMTDRYAFTEEGMRAFAVDFWCVELATAILATTLD